jgi:hypothetical protein
VLVPTQSQPSICDIIHLGSGRSEDSFNSLRALTQLCHCLPEYSIPLALAYRVRDAHVRASKHSRS